MRATYWAGWSVAALLLCSAQLTQAITPAPKPASDAQLLNTARAAYTRSDNALNAAWRLAVRRLEQTDRDARDAGLSVASVDLLRDAQRKWVAFRDAECLIHGQLTGGSVDRLAYFGCMQAVTEERVKQLREWAASP